MKISSEDVLKNLYLSISELEKIMISLKNCEDLSNEQKTIKLKIAYAVTDINEAIGVIFSKRLDLIPKELKHIDFSKSQNSP